MNVLIAIDKFKGSISSENAGKVITQTIQTRFPKARVRSVPVADGGDGSLEVLESILGFRRIICTVKGPLGSPVRAWYGWKKKVAYIEMAKSAGLVLLSHEERNPLLTSTFGVGELIKDAVLRGAKEVYLFVGGSSTNDAGTGMAEALGFGFLDEHGNPLLANGRNLSKIKRIQLPDRSMGMDKVRFHVVTDVDNLLSGPSGATLMFGPQKGADSHALKVLEQGMIHFGKLADHTFSMDAKLIPGSGAAGGLGAGAMWFLDADILPGTQTITRLLGLSELIAKSDYVITGEGRFDEQSLHGKVVSGIVDLAVSFGVPAFVFCGSNQVRDFSRLPINSEHVYSISGLGIPKKEAIQNPKFYLQQLTYKWMDEWFL